MFYLHFEGTKKVWMGSDNENGPKRHVKTRRLGQKYVFFFFISCYTYTNYLYIYIFRHKKGWGAQQQ